MDIVVRKYFFKEPDLSRLRELGSQVASPEDFCKNHGNLLSLLRVNIAKGSMGTLVQFYDPLYHGFTFPDYQLVPTLEEYSYLVGLPILDKVPFSGLEPTSKPQTIANSLHLKTSIIQANLISRGGLLGLSTKFIYQQASTFAEMASNDAFYSNLALLIYGLVLFPNIDDFVDINTIQIFLTKNPVPTLLADTYHSIHDRTSVGRGTIFCCTPLLYKWFISHLPQTHSCKANPENLPWSQIIMSLTPSDIVWYHPACDVGEIIVSCGEYPNVPLLGMRGGISYNPTLAKRQFGYPIKAKPDNITLANEFYLNPEDPSNKRRKFVQAWHAIRRLGRGQLGRKSDVVHKSYLQWVIDRARNFGMPYEMFRGVSATTPPSSLPLPFDTKEEFQEILAKLSRERDAWKTRCEVAELENETLKGKLEQKDHMILTQNRQIVEGNVLLRRKDDLLRHDSKRRKRNMDLFSGSQSISDDSPTSKV
ncbi:hypothetical protein QL285_076261 [Trifolium repens]|nr:hypothetical protein QL285_076261 [Trifolium repens]